MKRGTAAITFDAWTRPLRIRANDALSRIESNCTYMLFLLSIKATSNKYTTDERLTKKC